MDNNLSYLSTPLQGNYMYESLPDRLRHLAEENGDREAFVFYDQAWQRHAITRQELLDKSTSLAKVLVSRGLQRGSAVGFCMSNSLDMLVANMAAVCAGGVPFYMGTNLRDGSDLVELLNRMQCALFFIQTEAGDGNWNLLDKVWPENEPRSKAVPSLKYVVCSGNVSDTVASRVCLADLLREVPTEGTQLPRIQPEDTIAHFCTSGSTGAPKEVVYSHFCIFNWTKQSDFALGITGDSRFFCDRTFSWVVGYPRTYLVEGATRVFVDPRLTSSRRCAEAVANVVETEKCDVVYVPNYIASDLLSCPQLSGKFGNVRTAFFSGERFPEIYAGFQGRFFRRVCVYYGTTETGGIASFESGDCGNFEDGIIGKILGRV